MVEQYNKYYLITKEQIKKYLKDPTTCPWCNSTEVYTIDHDRTYNAYLTSIKYMKCKKRWTEIYKLVDIEEEEPDDEADFCPKCGEQYKTIMESNPNNDEDKTYYETKQCPNCDK